MHVITPTYWLLMKIRGNQVSLIMANYCVHKISQLAQWSHLGKLAGASLEIGKLAGMDDRLFAILGFSSKNVLGPFQLGSKIVLFS